MRGRALPLLLAALLWAPLAPAPARAQRPAAPTAVRELPALSDSAWGALVLSLSEEGGFFDTDNLISNERSYLHVLGPLRSIQGGAYIGVGPDQSFSYLAAIHPAVAFIVDIRRDNLLHHLLLRSLFALSSNRAEYLSRLHGRALPDDPRVWDARSLEDILARIEAQPVDSAAVRRTRQQVDSLVRALPLPISAEDRATIQRFHRAFIEQGPRLRFNTFGREPQPYYPTFRDLLLETDASGRQGSFLVREEDFRWVKQLEAKNLVVPVVGDLAGPKAIEAIGRWLADRRVAVTAYYTSNVEDYVWRDGGYRAFIANTRALPWSDDGVIIRSWFGRGVGRSPALAVRPGFGSAQLLQPASAFVRVTDRIASGATLTYEDVISAGFIPLR
jgi:hypothetical protein